MTTTRPKHSLVILFIFIITVLITITFSQRSEASLVSLYTNTPPIIDADISDWGGATSFWLTGEDAICDGYWNGRDDVEVECLSLWDKKNLYLSFLKEEVIAIKNNDSVFSSYINNANIAGSWRSNEQNFSLTSKGIYNITKNKLHEPLQSKSSFRLFHQNHEVFYFYNEATY